ncbi:hypothetical protein Q9L58_009260 [Maublancomyces gigas]|uniref:Uncharacterized protein n=1 Tax=Discina gigas TaxID=1032678 RepID=A0ABR3G7E9_9PEZI
MDVFKDSRAHPYLLGRVFFMPTNTGEIPAIAVPFTTAAYLLSTYTFLVLLIFAALWKIFVNLAMRFYPSRSEMRGNRYVAIAGIASSGDAWGAAFVILYYCWTMFFRARDLRSGSLALLILGGSLIIGTSRIVSGIIVPSSLLIGNVAPVDASFIFFPPSLSLVAVDQSMVFYRTIVQNAAQLATSYLSNVQESLLEPGPNGRVSINFTDLPTTPGGKSLRMDYRYRVTGVDLGLQFASQLSKTIHGTCETSYNLSDFADWENIRGFSAPSPDGAIFPQGLTPFVLFKFKEDEFHYFIAVNATGIESLGESDDPWYSTAPGELSNGSDSVRRTFKVLPDRPVVYCRQNETWEYGTAQIKGNDSIAELPGLKLKPVIRAYLQNDLNRLSPIALMPLLLGDRMLLSSATSLMEYFDSSIYSIREELTRLITLSFVLEGDIFRRTITNSPYRVNYANPALVNGTKADGVDDFVVRSSDVVTLSLKTLIIVPGALLITLLVLLALETTTCTEGNRGPGARYHIRRTAFNPMQMYRHIDESIGGNHVWKGRTSFVPYVTNPRLNGENMPVDAAGNGPTERSSPTPTTALDSDTNYWRTSGFVAPKVVDHQGQTAGADIEFTRGWDPELSIPWKNVGACRR